MDSGIGHVWSEMTQVTRFGSADAAHTMLPDSVRNDESLRDVRSTPIATEPGLDSEVTPDGVQPASVPGVPVFAGSGGEHALAKITSGSATIAERARRRERALREEVPVTVMGAIL